VLNYYNFIIASLHEKITERGQNLSPLYFLFSEKISGIELFLVKIFSYYFVKFIDFSNSTSIFSSIKSKSSLLLY
jgi:hypothetical protein